MPLKIWNHPLHPMFDHLFIDKAIFGWTCRHAMPTSLVISVFGEILNAQVVAMQAAWEQQVEGSRRCFLFPTDIRFPFFIA